MSSVTFLLAILAALNVAVALNLAPKFTADMNQHTIVENTPVGTVIYTLKGEDPEDSAVRFGLQGTDKFSVDPVTGDVTVVKDIDREEDVKGLEKMLKTYLVFKTLKLFTKIGDPNAITTFNGTVALTREW